MKNRILSFILAFLMLTLLGPAASANEGLIPVQEATIPEIGSELSDIDLQSDLSEEYIAEYSEDSLDVTVSEAEGAAVDPVIPEEELTEPPSALTEASVKAADTEEEQPQYVEVSGDYINGYGSSNKTQSSGFIYHDKMLLENENSFSTDLAKASVCLAMAAYDSEYVSNMMNRMGYTASAYQYTQRTLDDNDHVAYTVGEKDIPGTNSHVICVAVKGTSADEEWFSNFNLGEKDKNGGNHTGFYLAAQEVIDTLNSHHSASSADNIIWVTGHSRGAAVANIVAAYYTEAGNHVFGYTFACPNVSKNVVAYQNIYNINHTGDLVPVVPLDDWGYGRFGISIDWNMTADATASGYVFTDYVSADSTAHYESVLKEIVPTEDDFYDSAFSYFAINLVAYLMQAENTTTSFPAFVNKYGWQFISSQLTFEKLISSNSIVEAYEKIQILNEDVEEAYDLLKPMKEYVDELEEQLEAREITEEEFKAAFAQYRKNHTADLLRIAELIDETIEDAADVTAVFSKTGKLLNTAFDIGECIGAVFKLCDETTGKILPAINYAHTQSNYLIAVNRRYYGYRAYTYDNSLADLELDSNITTLGYECFRNSSIQSIDIPGVQYISGYAFEYCTDLVSVGLENLEAIGRYTFRGCENLMSIDISDLRYIPDYAFCACKSLQSVDLSNVEYIGSSGFDSCTGLTGIDLPKVSSIGYSAFSSCSGMTSVVLAHVEEIGSSAFYRCTGMQSLDLGDSITKIEENAFYGCSSLEDLFIPDSIKTLKTRSGHLGPFLECTGLKTISIGGLEKIECGMFRTGSRVLEKLTIRSSVKIIGTCAFNSSRGYRTERVSGDYNDEAANGYAWTSSSGSTELVIEEGVEEIEIYAFNGCKIFTSISIPTSIKTIGGFAFCDCNNAEISNLSLPVLQTLGSHAFENCYGLQDIELSENIKTIEVYTFEDCRSLTSVNLTYVKYVGEEAFWGCNKLTSVYYPSFEMREFYLNFKNSYGALYSAEWVYDITESLILPNSVRQLEQDAFYATGAEQVVLSPGVASVAAGALGGSDNLRYVIVKGANTVFEDGALSESPNVTVVCYSGSRAAAYCQDKGIPCLIK